MKILITFLFVLICSNLYGKKGPVTNLEIPRFVSLKSEDVNLRVGPSMNYPIELKYTQNNLPIEVIDEFDVWRKIIDYENNTGWIHKSLLKGERFILVLVEKENVKNIYNRPNGKKIGVIKDKNILSLKTCLIDWCYASNNKINGWLSKKNIWGVNDNELYKVTFFQPFINQYWKMLEKIIKNTDN